MKVAQGLHAAPQARRMQWLLVSCVSFALAACGGGGGGGNDSPPQTPPAQTNTAPTAQAGTDQTIQLPTNSVSMTGSATDAENNAITYAWTATPTGVTFADAAAAATTATFAAEGTYTLTLTASDGTLSGTDTVTVTVQAAAGGPANVAPTVDAGAARTVELPGTAVQLTGTATDDSLPSGSTLTYTWSTSVAGATIATPSALVTNVTLPATAGTYEFTLTASDGALSASDTVVITVSSAVYPGPELSDAQTTPLHGWATISPAEAGMDPVKLTEAQNYAISVGGGSGIIVKGGRIVHQWGDIDQRSDVKSTAKSVGGMLLGVAMDQGLLELDDLARTQHLPTLGDEPVAATNDPNQLDDITILQLATHTAGFNKPAALGELVNAPGTTWLYSDSSLNWLADVLSVTFNQDLETVLHAQILSRIGIPPGSDDVEWNQVTPTFSGRPNTINGIARRSLSSGIGINTHTMARIGLLFLRGGVWANNDRILSETFINTVRTPDVLVRNTTLSDQANEFPAANQHYGVLWWTNADGALGTYGPQAQEIPRDAYWAWGLFDSLIIVIPSRDLVIVRTTTGSSSPDVAGRGWNDGNWTADYSVLRPLIVPILESMSQP